MNDKRQKNKLANSGNAVSAMQMELAFIGEPRGEASTHPRKGSETPIAERGTESPAERQLMEEVCERQNCHQALKRVKANRGSAYIDGMTVEQLPDYLTQQWPGIREQLLSGTYRPQPVRRVEIPKPDGGVRKLGIPTVLDRFIQQAVMQVLQRRWDGTGPFLITFMSSALGGARIKRWLRHSSMWPTAAAGWWIWIWRNSWMLLHTAPWFMKSDRKAVVAGQRS